MQPALFTFEIDEERRGNHSIGRRAIPPIDGVAVSVSSRRCDGAIVTREARNQSVCTEASTHFRGLGENVVHSSFFHCRWGPVQGRHVDYKTEFTGQIQTAKDQTFDDWPRVLAENGKKVIQAFVLFRVHLGKIQRQLRGKCGQGISEPFPPPLRSIVGRPLVFL